MSTTQQDFDAMQARTSDAILNSKLRRLRGALDGVKRITGRTDAVSCVPAVASLPPCADGFEASGQPWSQIKPAKKPVQKESELQKRVTQLLRLKAITFMVPVFGRKTRMTVGWTDITFAIRGQACGWELKTGTNQLSADQKALHEKLTAEGWKISVIRSLEDAFEFLKQFGI